ncbi:MAG: hypothetical protein WC877_00815 [Dehalococcoidales bacterium]|jgi:hypothetical protein
MEKEKPPKIFTIKGTPYDIDEVYFNKLMVMLGKFLCKRYHTVDVVDPLELMSQIAYIEDLTIQQKMYLSYFLGCYSNNLEYEEIILNLMNLMNEDDDGGMFIIN